MKQIVQIFPDISDMLNFRSAGIEDLDLFFDWANDPLVRENSYFTEPIPYEQHVKWFLNKLGDSSCTMLLFLYDEVPCGQVRFSTGSDKTIIGVSVAKDFRGQGLASEIIKDASAEYFDHHPESTIIAWVKQGNESSIKSFLKAGYREVEQTNYEGVPSHKLIFNHE